ncbi:SWIM zinc finger family protein [Micromonospora sp. NBC_01796]|uniref:SWIM zinc finger family protein n=1 Tax=Micromonospora sp. NBC_01796 TaxID=2975987 RepID=UPI002DDBAD5F|nr:SWIM zinc finger family protein [Micromonospora sp. NBC_01796]WSA82890.1 SWIM zinc finger family protein [Micromonospora sp. NBC_01796]
MATLATYSYLRPSGLTPDDRQLTLQTSGGPSAHPRFFHGFLTTPEPAAVGLLAVAEVARARYYQPVSPASLDPVVTGGLDRLRFESFSGCCGVYARLDVLPAGLDGQITTHGTTNVDVNPPLRQALAGIGDNDPMHVAVGPDDLTVTTIDDGPLVERKVPLPTRWLRGFAEAQVITAPFEPRVEVSGAEATAFLRRLPSGSDRSVLWVVPAGRTLRLTSRAVPGAVCLPGAGRLVALRPFLRFATGLRVYGPAVRTGSGPVASTWELSTPALRLSLTLSPEPHRGFSGEGAVLAALAGDEVCDDADLVSALLSWDPTIDVGALAGAAGLPVDRVRAALTQLGTAGRVGYDVAEAGYFHRVLPYDGAAAERMNPRLVGARALVDAGCVTVDGDLATVRSGEETYRVRWTGAASSCTCPWWAKYRGGRGPCKHALAVRLVTTAATEPAEVWA